MCGIAGIVSLNGQAPDGALIFKMTRSMAHRGPDGEGYLVADETSNNYSHEKCPVIKLNNKRPIYFGHRRLSIVDLSEGGAQPMPDVSKKYWITFNGEIYNHRELRKQLEAAGQQFKSDHSDTEVILASYKQWGFECLKKFKGMFAFALWDTEKDLVWIVRDRFGKKPLYYGIKNGKYYFASEVKAILRCKDFKREMNLQAFSDYLSFTFVPPPQTLFNDINKLAAGHYMVIKNGTLSNQIPYYNVFDKVQLNADMPEEEAIEGFKRLFTRAIDYRRESDVPYGAYLSGGVDSSSVVAKLTKITGKPVYTFSVGFSNEIEGYTNEFEYARTVAKIFNSNHHEIELKVNDFLDIMPKLVWHHDEPISDVACVPLYYLSKLARDNGVIVCLGGEGSDETFIGYQGWRMMHEYQMMHDTFPYLRKAIKAGVNVPVVKKRRPYYSEWSNRISQNQRVFRGGIENYSDYDKDVFFKKGFQESADIQPVYRIIDYYNMRYKAESGSSDLLNNMSFIDLNLRLPELLLSRIDKMSMAASVEARAPFMDEELIEFALSIPARIKMKNKVEKYIIKKGMEGTLPDSILYRRKDGFTIPIDHFLKDKMFAYLEEKINAFAKDYDFMSDEARKALINVQDERHSWYFLNVAIWWDVMSNENYEDDHIHQPSTL
jgi:asparagine synthase (glutamine-hydrolysing)